MQRTKISNSEAEESMAMETGGSRSVTINGEHENLAMRIMALGLLVEGAVLGPPCPESRVSLAGCPGVLLSGSHRGTLPPIPPKPTTHTPVFPYRSTLTLEILQSYQQL